MRTPSEPTQTSTPRAWNTPTDARRRSVFGNYSASETEEVTMTLSPPGGEASHGDLQRTIDTAVARCFLYQFLARAFDDPTEESWGWLTGQQTKQSFLSAAAFLLSAESGSQTLAAKLNADDLDAFQIAYVTAFGHAARGDCPLNEIEYGDLKADPLFQPHRLADLAGFYRAFGMEVADSASERPDHLGMELEFMALLAAREAYAHEHQLDSDHVVLDREAQKKFLREHIGRWVPAFARRLSISTGHEPLALLARFLGQFISAECRSFGVATGHEDLLLRPADQAENLCASCGLQNLPPGAHPSPSHP